MRAGRGSVRRWGPIAAAVLMGVAATPMGAAHGDVSGYRFDDVAVIHAGAHSVTVEYEYGWAGPEFPGWVSCAWTVEDAEGRLVAEKTVQIVGLERAYTSKEIEIPKIPASRAGTPDRAGVSCDRTRLDDPRGTYSFSSVTAKLTPEFEGDRRSVSLSFDVDWSGATMPGVGECLARVRSSDDALLFEHPFTLTSSDSSLSMRAIAPFDLARDPSSADVECAPYSG